MTSSSDADPLLHGTPSRRPEARTARRYRWPVVAVVATLAAVATVTTIILAAPATGVMGELVLSGGPGDGSQLRGQPVELIISSGGRTVLSKDVPSSTVVKVSLSPGTYAISAKDGNADCGTSSVQVKTGAFSSFEVVCSLR